MYKKETQAIGRLLEKAVIQAYGEEYLCIYIYIYIYI